MVPVRQFVLEWGNLGEGWGVNRSVSQIHALLYASKQPLAAEDIADALGIALLLDRGGKKSRDAAA